VVGLAEPERHLVACDAISPTLTVVQGRVPDGASPGEPGAVSFDDGHAEIQLGAGARIELDRATLTVRFSTHDELDDRSLVHPYLAVPVSIASHWLGRQTLHGGAFLRGGRAIGVLGAKGAGKSSTMGWLLQRGHDILSDDLLVLDGRTLYSGPRCVDLRPDAATVLGGDDLGVIGARHRWRLSPGSVSPSTPLGGLVYLAWADDVSVELVPPDERLHLLLKHLVLRPEAADALPLLDLAALPAWRLRRPQRLDVLDEAMAQLLDALG
jgi:hypothetical protein